MGSAQPPELDAEGNEITEEQLDIDLSGQDLGRYRILERVGQGSMCSVYKAYQAGLDRYVAIKVLPTRFSRDALLTARFQREAQSIARLKHPNILQVYDVGQEGELPYIVMQYVEGGTLKSLLGQPLPLDYTVEIIAQIAAALEEAHRQGIIHRDVKPSNVLMERPDWFLLSDFGLARVIKASARLTESGITVGTPAYMSPEQGRGEKVDGRSDVYSLGVVLFEMLTGALPYEDSTPMSVVVKHITAPVPHPSEFNPDISEPVERVVMKALAKDLAERYGSAKELSSALKKAAASVSSPKVKLVEKPAPLPDRSLPSPEKTAQPTDSDELQGQSARRYLWPAGIIALVALILAIAITSGLFGVGRGPTGSERGEQDLPSGVAVGFERTLVAEPSVALAQTSTPTPIPTTMPAATDVYAPVATHTIASTEPTTPTPPPASTPTADAPAPPAATDSPAPPTPDWPATVTAQAETLALAVAAMLTAQSTPTTTFTTTATSTDTPAPTNTMTATPTPTPTATDTPVPPTATDTPAPPTPDWPATVTAQAKNLAMAVAATLTAQPTLAVTFTPSPPTATPTATHTVAPTATDTPTATPTDTMTVTPTHSPTSKPTATATDTPAPPTTTDTPIPPTPDWPVTVTAQARTLATAIAMMLTAQATPTAMDTATSIPSPTHTATAIPTPTHTATAIPTDTPTATPTSPPRATPTKAATPTRVPPTTAATETATSSSLALAAIDEELETGTRSPNAAGTPDATAEASPSPVAISAGEAGLYPAPELLNPGHGFTTGDGQTSFEWAWSQELRPEECFELVMSGSLDGPFWGAVACMKEKRIAFNVLQASHIKPGPAGQYFWTVRVNSQLPGDQWSTVSATAEPREMRVSAGGSGSGSSSGGGSNPPPP